MSKSSAVFKALQAFADGVATKMSQLTSGEPEEQLRGPFENFMSEIAAVFDRKVVCIGETPLPNSMGKPDFAVHANKLLVGYVELKAPGTGANAKQFKGHNRSQFKRFSAIPNMLYTDGNEWALYRNGMLVDKLVRVSGNVSSDGKNAVKQEDAVGVEALLLDFLAWDPIVLIPMDRKGKIDLKRFAAVVAPLCRLLREDVTEALQDADSPITQLAENWRQLLFPDASNEQFADAYAQTVSFALLLGRSEGADPLTFDSAKATLAAQHNLLSRALQVLTDLEVRAVMPTSLELLLRVIAEVPLDALSGPEDPWIYFYEDFLAAYDPKLRKDAGAYYTPVEVVHAQVRLIDDLLVNRLGKPLGFADPSVVTLDPATGTGTYLLGVIEHALERIRKEQGPGAVAGRATDLAKNLYGFEIMVGPYAVTELRVSQALKDRGASLPEDGTHIYLTDTLESPHAEPPQVVMGFAQKAFAEQHKRATRVKAEVPVIVCLGNPPYDRHEAATEGNKARTGGWVRWGASGTGSDAILRDFIDPAIAAGHGVHVKNLYNLYVYFWRWALWKVFEQNTMQSPGVVSFITASSFLDGDAFCGMRELMRRTCDEIWVLDLGGEGRGVRKNENVFAIQTPVTIVVAVGTSRTSSHKPAKTHYASVEGSRRTKLTELEGIDEIGSVEWVECERDWHVPLRPSGMGTYFLWPLLTELMPWQHSGSQLKRTWPICADRKTLENRWRTLLASHDQVSAFKETRDRKVDSRCFSLLDSGRQQPAIAQLPRNEPVPKIERYAYRSFDRQWIIADSRLGDFLRPTLWAALSAHQLCVTSLFSQPLGAGPALTVAPHVPDLDHFRGSYGAKATIPLYRTADASESNILPGLLELLSSIFGKRKKITPEDFLAYVYGALAHPAFTERFTKELETRELRVPITKDSALFEKVRYVGARLLWLHTYGERYVPKGKARGQVPTGSAKCTKAVPGDKASYPEEFRYNDSTKTLHVGAGEFRPVTSDIFEFEVSGLKVVQSWLKYRMKKGSGKKSSPLDDIRPERWTSQFTTELLELLWVLEATIAGYPKQAELLDAIIECDCFTAAELPEVQDKMRKPPPRPKAGGDLFDDV